MPITVTLPSDTKAPGSTGHTTDHNVIVDAVSAIAAEMAVAFNDRGVIAASTTYNPGDVVIYKGNRIYVTATFTTGAGNPPFVSFSNYIKITSQAMYYATDFGVVADGTTDNATALNNALQFVYNAGGGFLILPGGYAPIGGIVATSKTIIIPPSVILAGQGMEVTEIKLLAGANCDVIQFETYNSSSQAAILGITATSLRNAFYAGLMNLAVHGNAANQGFSTYTYGVNLTTNPTSSAGTGDPDFDPFNILHNVEIRSCTGDGLFHNGRGGLRAYGVLCRYSNGWGAVPSFDALYSGCNFGFNGLGGIYQNHSSTSGAACKVYNNGTNAQWVSGSNYPAGTVVMAAGVMYRALNTLTADTVAPASDPANWVALSGATAPQGWGYGLYIDSVVSEAHWTAVDGQENSAGDFYLKNCTGVIVEGVSNRPNFNNQSGAGQNATNPNNYASLTLDGATGCIATVAVSGLSAGAVYPLRVISSATRNDVRIAGDNTVSAPTSPDSAALPGSGNAVTWNGRTLAASSSGLRVTEGSNAKQGTATLTAGTVTVANTSVTANSRIFLTVQSLGTVTAPSALAVTARTPGTSFTILASQNTDTSVIAYEIIEPG